MGLAAEPRPNGLNEALIRLRHIVRPGSLVICISDFLTLDESAADELLRLRRHNDLVSLQITDPIEMSTPPPGRYGVSDGLRFGELDTGSNEVRRHYQEFFDHRRQRLQGLMHERAIPFLRLSTTDDVTKALQVRFGDRRRLPAARGTVA